MGLRDVGRQGTQCAPERVGVDAWGGQHSSRERGGYGCFICTLL